MLSVHGQVARKNYPQDLKNSVKDDSVRFVVGDSGVFKSTGLPDFTWTRITPGRTSKESGPGTLRSWDTSKRALTATRTPSC
jgi:hypothetical protein